MKFNIDGVREVAYLQTDSMLRSGDITRKKYLTHKHHLIFFDIKYAIISHTSITLRRLTVGAVYMHKSKSVLQTIQSVLFTVELNGVTYSGST